MAIWLLFPILIAAPDVPLHGETVVHLATAGEARALLTTRDAFVKALSPFDRQSRVETDRDVSEEEFLKFLEMHALPWTDEQEQRMGPVVESLRAKLAPLRLNFPRTVQFIQTTGREEGNAAYCRGTAVLLPRDKIDLSRGGARLERLITHELFHILTGHDPRARQSLYGIIGFHDCPPIDLPASLRDRKLTNPDAVARNACIRLRLDDGEVRAVPILYSRIERFDPARGGPFFRYLKFQLMVVEEAAGTWRPVEHDGKPRLLDPEGVPDFTRQIGENTAYIIHPDEILADNFVHLIHGSEKLPNPEIVEQMGKLLRRATSSEN